MQHPYVNLNGAIVEADEARGSVFDHGLLYGDGLFETIRLYDGGFFRLAAHLARLERSAAQIRLAVPWDKSVLHRALTETAAFNGMTTGALRLTVTRGAGEPIPDVSASPHPSFFITARSYAPDPDLQRAGVRVCFAGEHPRWMIPAVKSLSYQPFVLARHVARERGCHEGLLTNGDLVVEGSTANIFILEGEALLTPGLESGCLPGIMRQAVLELAADLGIGIREVDLRRERVVGADEAFLTSSLAGILPVTAIEQQPVGSGVPGGLTLELCKALAERVAREKRP